MAVYGWSDSHTQDAAGNYRPGHNADGSVNEASSITVYDGPDPNTATRLADLRSWDSTAQDWYDTGDYVVPTQEGWYRFSSDTLGDLDLAYISGPGSPDLKPLPSEGVLGVVATLQDALTDAAGAPFAHMFTGGQNISSGPTLPETLPQGDIFLRTPS